MNTYSTIRFLSNIARAAKEASMPLWMPLLRKTLDKPLSGCGTGVTVSLTSMPSRIDTLWVEILILPYNLRSHNKYYHTFQHCRDACVITVDDDCWYARDTISRLLSLHGRYPDAVVANVARVIGHDSYGEYRSWEKSRSCSPPDHTHVAIGFGGILYPPHFADRCDAAGFDLFDMDAIRELAPTADDLWLKAAETVSGIGVACGGFFPTPVTVWHSQKISLRSINKGGENRNDIQWKALDARFNLKQIIQWTQS